MSLIAAVHRPETTGVFTHLSVRFLGKTWGVGSVERCLFGLAASQPAKWTLAEKSPTQLSTPNYTTALPLIIPRLSLASASL
jgi:hypothetical protein